jgi:hypothetical protein
VRGCQVQAWGVGVGHEGRRGQRGGRRGRGIEGESEGGSVVEVEVEREEEGGGRKREAGGRGRREVNSEGDIADSGSLIPEK